MLTHPTIRPHTQVVLPTQDIVHYFIAETERMVNMDYDMDEVLSNAFTAIAFVPDIERRIRDFFTMYRSWGSGNGTRPGPEDGEILANAFLGLIRNLLDIYKRLGMWQGDGFCPYYYVDRLNYDCILNKHEDA